MPAAQLPDDALIDFDQRTQTIDDVTKAVYVAGTGPAVIVMTEMPGISPHVARFARWVRDAGFTVFMPSLFGRDGVNASADEGVEVFKRTCISAEFKAAAADRPSPIITWLRKLAVRAHQECGGPGVGAVGMCFTGNFALSMMLEGPTMAPVVCQPSLPLEDPAAVGIPESDLEKLRHRLESEDLTVMGYRFEGDRWCTAARFAAYSKALGPRFVARVLPDSAAHLEPPPFFKHVVASPHSVVTAHLIDEQGQPTAQARDEILRFLALRLCTRATLAPC
jgi:dienelactone hydrolase